MPTLIHKLNSLATGFFDILLRPLTLLPPFWSLTLLSLATGLLMLGIFGLVSDQKNIRRSKDRIQAGLIATRLFQNDLGVFFRIQGRIAFDTAAYLKHSLKPMLVMIVPVIIVLIQLNGRFSVRPPEAGEAVLVKVKMSERRLLDSASGIRLLPGEGISLDSPPVRIPSKNEVAWRILPNREGKFILAVEAGGERREKRFIAGKSVRFLSSVRTGEGLLDMVLHPGEPPLDSSSIRSIRVIYPPLDLRFSGWPVNWLIYFFILSILSGYALKGFFGIHV